MHHKRVLLNIFEHSLHSLQEHVHVFRLKHEGRSESNGHVTAAPSLESLVSKRAHDLVTSGLAVAVDGTEGARPTSAVNQAWVKPLQIRASRLIVYVHDNL